MKFAETMTGANDLVFLADTLGLVESPLHSLKQVAGFDLVGFYDISTFVGYLMPNPFLYI